MLVPFTKLNMVLSSYYVFVFTAERKIREAMVKERDASDLEKLVFYIL